MNRRQIEVQQAVLNAEKEVISRLKEVYGQAAEECEARIMALSMRKDMENLQSIIWQKQYQEALKKQLDSILNDLNTDSFDTIAEYLTECYEHGFWGTMYDLQGQGIPLCFPMDQEAVVRAVRKDTKLSKGLYQRLGEDIDGLKRTIRSELSRGIANGLSWGEIAGAIAGGMNSPMERAYKNSIRIARTEGHRIQNESAFDCQMEAKNRGADIFKQWDSTLDSLTRPHHVELDGQVRAVEEPFEVAGMKAMYPGGFGIAGEDCNCRCCLLSKSRRQLSDEEYYTKWDGNKNELVRIRSKSYDEFRRDAQIHLMKIQFPDDVYKIRGITEAVKDELETALLKLKSEYDIRLHSITVEKAGGHDIFITGYHDGVMDMVVNEDADFDAIIRRIPLHYASGKFAGKSLEDYVAHEMAHVMLYQDCMHDSEFRAKFQQVEGLYDSLRGISGYADETGSGNEALAEAFVRVRNGESVTTIAKILVESYFGRFKK